MGVCATLGLCPWRAFKDVGRPLQMAAGLPPSPHPPLTLKRANVPLSFTSVPLCQKPKNSESEMCQSPNEKRRACRHENPPHKSDWQTVGWISVRSEFSVFTRRCSSRAQEPLRRVGTASGGTPSRHARSVPWRNMAAGVRETRRVPGGGQPGLRQPSSAFSFPNCHHVFSLYLLIKHRPAFQFKTQSCARLGGA